MLRLLALLLGEALLIGGLAAAWWPLAAIVAGAQIITAVLLSEHEPKPKRGERQ